MALGLQLEEKKSGNFLPVLKFDAKSGDFVAVNREPASDGGWEKEEIELKTPFKFVMDLNAMEIGWISFKPGAVDFTMTQIGSRLPARPTDDHKQGVRMKVYLKEHGLREFAHTSKNVLRAINALHDDFIANADKNPGKLPVVEVSGTETVKMQTKEQGELRFKVPKWSIVAWIGTPPAFSGETPEVPAKEVAKEPPKAMPKAKSVIDDDEEF